MALLIWPPCFIWPPLICNNMLGETSVLHSEMWVCVQKLAYNRRAILGILRQFFLATVEQTLAGKQPFIIAPVNGPSQLSGADFRHHKFLCQYLGYFEFLWTLEFWSSGHLVIWLSKWQLHWSRMIRWLYFNFANCFSNFWYANWNTDSISISVCFTSSPVFAFLVSWVNSRLS